MRPSLEPDHAPSPEKEFSLSAFKGAFSAGLATGCTRGRGLRLVILEDPGSTPCLAPQSRETATPLFTLHPTPGLQSLHTASGSAVCCPACETSACSCLILPPCLPTQNLRVRSSGGTEFFTRSATKFKGVLAQKFMFVDGDRAVCGSYR